MNFSYDEEETLLADTVTRWADKEYAAQANGDAKAIALRRWATLSELGLAGLHVPAELGGLARPATDAFIVMQAIGRRCLDQPFISNSLVSATLLARTAGEPVRDRYLGELIGGSRTFALAMVEDEPSFRFDQPRTRCVDGRLYGGKSAVIDADLAKTLIVTVAGERPGQIRLALVDTDAPGVRLSMLPTIDGRRAAEVTFDGTEVRVDHWLESRGPDAPAELLDEALDRGRAAHCAEASGLMNRLFDLTVEHLKSRTQFGQPLGKFQALQHRAVEMLVLAEQVHSMALRAAAGIDGDSPIERRSAVSAAKALIGQHGRQMGEWAVQLFGGMGVTEELEASRCFKRLLAIDLTWGNAGYHADRYAASSAHVGTFSLEAIA
ncbi:acyl-CoA dehydrogenase family protein [Hydrogenophaga sp. BPS33]|uniref:acyl-CoA dehydrogenase family protein n=1 Tax=Hydrogenophaga sp. BPS33 TaxID=2651974 RepID=UPI00131FACA3|nr:acyl-CoA dehydrogenase family protein [Hydrogenophaga sp. BPS33]QHE84780.1 pimeloyl-CoA dehydrogenase small subunit [Hydrogenophaga sp. BPS33]